MVRERRPGPAARCDLPTIATTAAATVEGNNVVIAAHSHRLGQRVCQLTDGLIRRGYSNRQIELILGGNFLRALAWIWPAEPLAPVAGPWVERRDPFCPPVPLDG